MSSLDSLKEKIETWKQQSLNEPKEWPPARYADKVLSEFEAHGFRCVVMRGPTALCGYVLVPASHRYASTFYGDIEDVRVHGGLTFQQRDIGGGMWFGFDCGHYGDRIRIPGGSDWPGHDWSLDEVAAETTRLADELARPNEAAAL